MALTFGNKSNQVFEAQSTSKTSWASAALNCNADSLILAICALGKASGSIPSFSSLSNNKGLTFARRGNGNTTLTGGNQIYFEYWWARAAAAQTGLVATFNWAAACQADRGDLVMMEVRGVNDWSNPFDMAAPVFNNYMHSTTPGAYPSLSLTKTKSSVLRFGYWFSKYVSASGAPSLPVSDYNGNSPSSYYRRGLAHDIGSSSSPLVASYSTATSYSVIGIGDTIQGDSAPLPKSRPVVVLTG